MANLTDERKEKLLSELVRYRYEKENNIKALEILSKNIESLKEEEGINDKIAYQSERIKKENSFLNKINDRINRENKDITYDNIRDVVGVRLVCLNLTDAKEVLEKIKNSKSFEIEKVKDYIMEPKESGYMGYHVIVKVPIVKPNSIKYVYAEIQIRTIFMDIFAREEHKLSYKGNATEKDKTELKKLSDELYFYDKALDELIRKEIIDKEEQNEEEIEKVKEEYKKIGHLYQIINNKFDEDLNSFIKNYDSKGDILHVTSRIKSLSSINRKLKRKKLSCNANNIITNIHDIIGFKVVCIDEKVALDFIKKFKEEVKEMDNVVISTESDRFTEPKESGYRGYKINLTFNIPVVDNVQPIIMEVIVRTMVMDAWALHDDKYFNSNTSNTTLEKQMRGLSYALRDVEEKLQRIKNNIKDYKPEDLVSEVELYNEEKMKSNNKTLTLKNSEIKK